MKSAATRKAGYRKQRLYSCRVDVMHNRWDAEAVDQAVLAAIAAYIESADLATIGTTDRQTARIAELRRQESELVNRRNALMESLKAGVLTAEEYREVKDLLTADIAGVAAEITGLSRDRVLVPLVRSDAPVQFFLNSDVLMKQAIIRALCPDGVVLNRRPPRKMFDPAALVIGLPGAAAEAEAAS